MIKAYGHERVTEKEIMWAYSVLYEYAHYET
jgi:hypothetical protein